jgi:site-specific DNA-methyltransferase (adenine-specific)
LPKKTKTSSFGVGKREGHDSSAFYHRSIFTAAAEDAALDGIEPVQPAFIIDDWMDKIHLGSAERMPLPDNSVDLAFTSPPYNVGKDYEDDISLEAYLAMIKNVAKEVYRVLTPGGRYVVNVANLGRKPYIPMHAYFYQVHTAVKFLPMGEIIWQKAEGANGSCAWGSWMSAQAPRLRDLHEYLLVFAKGDYRRPDKGVSDITKEEFMEATLSVWHIPAESAKRVGHPAPFSIPLAARVIRLYSYVQDVVLDPFVGSGTTCVAAKMLGRHYAGFDVNPDYILLANTRLAGVMGSNANTGDEG